MFGITRCPRFESGPIHRLFSGLSLLSFSPSSHISGYFVASKSFLIHYSLILWTSDATKQVNVEVMFMIHFRRCLVRISVGTPSILIESFPLFYSDVPWKFRNIWNMLRTFSIKSFPLHHSTVFHSLFCVWFIYPACVGSSDWR